MVKHYMNLEQATASLHASGLFGVIKLLVQPKTQLDVLCDNETDIVGVHKGEMIVRISSYGERFEGFAGYIVMYFCDGTTTNYLPAFATSNPRLENLMEGFATSGHISYKKITKTRFSAPLKIMGTSPIHQMTFVIDVKKLYAEISKFADDQLTNIDFDIDFALVTTGVAAETFHINTLVSLEYTVHNKPLRVFQRKTL